MYAQSPKSSKDLLFLEEALANITELLRTLNSKIEEIDLVFVLAVQNGESAAEDSSAQAQERQMKRAQLVMLKENIDVISDNLKALIARSKQKGAALFDVAAIEAVISEAATLLVLLNSEEEDEAVDQSEEFITDVQNIDQIVAQIEDEVTQIPAERMRSATVARDGFTTEPVTELDLRASVFDPRNPNKRPEGWANVQMKRVLRREQAEREEGIDEDTIAASRKGKEDEVLSALILITSTLLLFLWYHRRTLQWSKKSRSMARSWGSRPAAEADPPPCNRTCPTWTSMRITSRHRIPPRGPCSGRRSASSASC